MTSQRDRIAQAMAEGAGSMCFREPGREWDHLRSVWRSHADAAVNVFADMLKADWARYRGGVRQEVWEHLRDAPNGPLIDAMNVVNDMLEGR